MGVRHENTWLEQIRTDTRREAYWRGLNHGRRLAEHEPLTDHEHALRLSLQCAVGHNAQATDKARAYALGELRGYRQATDRP